MKLIKNSLRMLCGMLDIIIILMPIQFIMMGIFGVSVNQAEFFFKFLFAVYGYLMMEYTGGRTIGKYLGKIKVIDVDGGDCKAMYLGLRELSKSLYLIPVIGWVLAIVSIGMSFTKSERMIHDYIGGTRVVAAQQEGIAVEEKG